MERLLSRSLERAQDSDLFSARRSMIVPKNSLEIFGDFEVRRYLGPNDPEGPNDQEGPSDPEGINILKINEITIRIGEQIYLKDPTIINAEFVKKVVIVPTGTTKIDDDFVFLNSNNSGNHIIDYYIDNIKDSLNIKVSRQKVTGTEVKDVGFFESSKHFIGDIDRNDINDLVKQLLGLDYDNKHLLYIISFRAILEDLVKSYIIRRSELKLTGKFKDNITTMLSDLQSVLKPSKSDPLKTEKTEIQEAFKGYDAINNFLIGVSVKFTNNNYDKFLHSLTHNPSKIDKSLALEIANDIILPLYVLIKKLKDKKII